MRRPWEPLLLKEHQQLTDQDEGDWVDATFLRYLEAQADESVTLEQVRTALAKIPDSMVEDFPRERDERSFACLLTS